MQPRTLEIEPVTSEDIETWAMTVEDAAERSRTFLSAKLAQLALTADADDFDLAA